MRFGVIKVMHFIHGLNTGGAETLVKDYAINFDKKKIDFVLLCTSHEKASPYEELLRDKGIRVIFMEDYLWCKGRTDLFSKFINHYQRYFIARKIIRKEVPDILHTHLHLNRYVKFARLNKKTVIFHTVHSEPKVFWSDKNRNCKKDLAAARWLARNYGMRFIVLHEKMREKVSEMIGTKNSVVLNNGIDVARFKTTKKKMAMRVKLGIPKGAHVVGHVGRFVDSKNHRFLVDVFAKMKNQNKFLLMIGDGDNKREIVNELDAQGLSDRYMILSNRSDVPDLMGAMDVFVFPSKFEGLGMALVEAQEVRLPCFVSGKVPEHAVISNLVTRMLLADGAKKWASAIENHKQPKKIVVDDDEWDIVKITKQLERLYFDALAEKEDGSK